MKLKFALLLALACVCASAAIPGLPAVQGPVNDYAGVLTPSQRVELQHMLVNYADSTTNQICIVTVSDLGDMSAAEFAINIGLEWKVGSADFNNGIVFLVKPKPLSGGYGDAFIAVGRGLEGAIPDAWCTRIVNKIAVPYFAAGDYYNGIRESCLKLIQLSRGEYSNDDTDDEDVFIDLLLALVVIIVAVVILIVILSSISGKGGKGGEGSGRGGDLHRGIIWGNTITPGSFTRGGGFGGGGFSGGFHGGFGGGSFGGGGGGGRW